MSNQLNLSSDERDILNIYINQYNHIQSQITQLQNTSNTIQENMQFFINSLVRNNNENQVNSNTNNRHRSQNSNINSRQQRNNSRVQEHNSTPLFNTIYEYTFTLDRDALNTNTNFNNLLNSFLHLLTFQTPIFI
jgi:hypothetical protein